MTPTNLPGAACDPRDADVKGRSQRAAEQTQTTDFLLMLGQLVAASVQRSGTSLAPTSKVPAMFLDGDAKKDEIDPEQLLAMFSMIVPPQVHADQHRGAGRAGAAGVVRREHSRRRGGRLRAEHPAGSREADYGREVVRGRCGRCAQVATTPQTPDGSQLPTLPVQLQQPQPVTGNVHDRRVASHSRAGGLACVGG